MKHSSIIVTLVVVTLFLGASVFSRPSEAFNYAKILELVEANDPVTVIVETVREESRIYPRPTKIDLFKEKVFDIDPQDLGKYIEQILAQQEFNDIQRIQASTGVHYLYSTRYITTDHAKSLIEWEEVERYENQ